MKHAFVILGAGMISGLMLALALPPIGLWWLGPICLAPVLAAVAGRGLLKGFLGGLVAPGVCYLTVQYSGLTKLPEGDNNSRWVMICCGFFGILVAVMSCIAAETKGRGWRRIWLLTSLALLLELSLFPILPSHLALTLSKAPGMMILASIGGIWLVSVVVWGANIAFAEALRSRNIRIAQIAVGALVLCAMLGMIPVSAPGQKMRVAAIQTDNHCLANLEKMNLEAGKKGAVLAVWPESSGIMGAPGGDASDLRAISAKSGQPAFVTSFQDDLPEKPHNTAALFSKGRESEHYYKQKLFGGEKDRTTPGDRAMAAPHAGSITVGLNICFDSCYPAMMRDTGRLDGVGLVAIPTADPDSTSAFLAANHAAFTTFRAAESGVAMVRGDSFAFSQIVDSTGRVVAEMPARQEGVLVADVPTGRRWTLYSVLGDWVLFIACGTVCVELLALVVARIKIARGVQPILVADSDC